MKKKIVKLINDALDFTQFVPIGWVLTCYDLGLSWISEKFLEGIMNFEKSAKEISRPLLDNPFSLC